MELAGQGPSGACRVHGRCGSHRHDLGAVAQRDGPSAGGSPRLAEQPEDRRQHFAGSVPRSASRRADLEAVDRDELSADRLEVEITESSFLEDQGTALTTVE